jgi:hypothetical protein
MMRSEQKGLSVVVGKLASRLLNRLQQRSLAQQPRLALVDRITLGPRQTLALVEAEGRRFLVASSQDGSPSFYPLGLEAPNGKGSRSRIAGGSRKAW